MLVLKDLVVLLTWMVCAFVVMDAFDAYRSTDKPIRPAVHDRVIMSLEDDQIMIKPSILRGVM